MKFFLILSLITLSINLKAADFITNRVITIEWDNHPDATNFFIYSKTNLLTQPVWLPLTNTTSLTNEISMRPQQMYFTVTASNFWGESDFSEVVSTPNPPRSDDISVRIRLK